MLFYRKNSLIFLILAALVLMSCQGTGGPVVSSEPAAHVDFAGLRASEYGFGVPKQAWLESTLKSMAGRFTDARPAIIWIASTYNDKINEKYLSICDAAGVAVLLQVEPHGRSVESLMKTYMDKFGHHSSIIGFGVDVEWYGKADMGDKVSDADAEAWVKQLRAYKSDYILMLKHFNTEWMPPTYREGILFLSDSQMYPDLDRFINETDGSTAWGKGFKDWAETFAPAPVGLQYGYDDDSMGASDRKWWSRLADPQKEIGAAVLAAAPNCRYLFWVDFTAKQVNW